MPPSMEAWSLNHWTTRDVPTVAQNKVISPSKEYQRRGDGVTQLRKKYRNHPPFKELHV